MALTGWLGDRQLSGSAWWKATLRPVSQPFGSDTGRIIAARAPFRPFIRSACVPKTGRSNRSSNARFPMSDRQFREHPILNRFRESVTRKKRAARVSTALSCLTFLIGKAVSAHVYLRPADESQASALSGIDRYPSTARRTRIMSCACRSSPRSPAASIIPRIIARTSPVADAVSDWWGRSGRARMSARRVTILALTN